MNSLDSNSQSSAYVNLISENGVIDTSEVRLIQKLLLDPQTCGPLMIACDSNVAQNLVKDLSWHQIGLVNFV